MPVDGYRGRQVKDRKRAKRMPPEERRTQILDAAVQLILQTGHSRCSLEQCAAEAGISKALIYKYFANHGELLEALLQREFEFLSGQGLDAIPSDAPIDRVIRSTVGRAMRYYAERGPIIRILSADPVIASAARQGNRVSVANTAAYFVERSVAHYGVPEDVAIIAVTLVINAPIHSMAQLDRRGVDLERTIEVWCEFIIAGWAGIQARFGAPRQLQTGVESLL